MDFSCFFRYNMNRGDIMSTRKNMTFPIIITVIIILIIVYLFANLKQTRVVCNQTYTFDSNVTLTEKVDTVIEGKKITELSVTKTIVLPDRFADETHLNSLRFALNNTLEYLGDKVKYNVSSDRMVIQIDVHKNEVVLLKNIQFSVNEDLGISINSNTKSSEVITLTVGDNYTDGEFMKRMKNNGYRCK